MVGQADVSKLLSSDDEAEPGEATVPQESTATFDFASDPAPPSSIGAMVGQADVSKPLSSDDEVLSTVPVQTSLLHTAEHDSQPEHVALDVASAAYSEAEAADILAAAAAAARSAAADAPPWERCAALSRFLLLLWPKITSLSEQSI